LITFKARAPTVVTPAPLCDAGEFHPPSYATLFDVVLRGVSIKKRPPQEFCEMCEGHFVLDRELRELRVMLGQEQSDEEKAEEMEFPEWYWGKYENRQKAQARARVLERLVRAREQHAIWVRTQRIAVLILPFLPCWVWSGWYVLSCAQLSPTGAPGAGAASRARLGGAYISLP
jgi:hypothetical protein